MIKYECSNGERVSEATIKKRLSNAYREWYAPGLPRCAGCGGKAIETSHIISKARCKELHKTELIWDRENTFPSCRKCHVCWESINDSAWCDLMIMEHCMNVLWVHDDQSYNKRMAVYESYAKGLIRFP